MSVLAYQAFTASGKNPTVINETFPYANGALVGNSPATGLVWDFDTVGTNNLNQINVASHVAVPDTGAPTHNRMTVLKNGIGGSYFIPSAAPCKLQFNSLTINAPGGTAGEQESWMILGNIILRVIGPSLTSGAASQYLVYLDSSTPVFSSGLTGPGIGGTYSSYINVDAAGAITVNAFGTVKAIAGTYNPTGGVSALAAGGVGLWLGLNDALLSHSPSLTGLTYTGS